MPPAIAIENLRKCYRHQIVLDQLTLDVNAGELLVILGDSGSGKSTLLKLIAGLESPDRGSIQIRGVDQSKVLPHQRDVAVVFQDGNGYDHLTVRQNLALAAKNSSNASDVSHWVNGLGLASTMDQRLSELSGGQAQRVAIARAMLSNKSIVLLDEPLAHLNQSLREEIRNLIVKVHRVSKRTFVYVTHDSDEAFYLADRIGVLGSGRILQVGDARTLYRAPASMQVASALGQPTIDKVESMQSGLETSSTTFEDSEPSTTDLVACGMRSHDWTIVRIDARNAHDHNAEQVGFSKTASRLTVIGRITKCRWMGSRWLLEVRCPTLIRMTYPSPADASIELALRNIEGQSADSELESGLGYVHATISFKDLIRG
jgi:ABC-type sugar transport system ATPase subunit